MDVRGKALDSSESFGVKIVFESRRKAYSSQHAQLVFFEPPLWCSDSANDAQLKVLLAANIIEDLVLHGIQQQAVYGEVAALHVFARIVGIAHTVRMAAIAIANVAA